MRHFCEDVLRGENHRIRSFDGKIIDCMLFKAANFERDQDQNIVTPVVLFFNANCSIYEYAYLQHDMIRFYLKRGVSIFMFNYRGYSRS